MPIWFIFYMVSKVIVEIRRKKIRQEKKKGKLVLVKLGVFD